MGDLRLLLDVYFHCIPYGLPRSTELVWHAGLLMGDVLPRETENTVYRYLLAISELRLGIRTYAERHGEAIFACEMTAGRLPAHGDDARPRVAKGSHWYPPDNAPHVRQPVPARRERRLGSRSDTDALTSRSLSSWRSVRRGVAALGAKASKSNPPSSPARCDRPFAIN